MQRILTIQAVLLAAAVQTAVAIQLPTGLVIASGDKSVILHWDPNTETNLAGYNVLRAPADTGPFVQQNTGLLTSLGYCDLSVSDEQAYYYQVVAVDTTA